MRKFRRLPAPKFLAFRWEEWGRDWERSHCADSKAAFHWHQVEGERVNLKLLPTLKFQVQDHRSCCDNYPVSPPSNETIEHFRPKAKFPREAYQWENLYFSCDHCQGKGSDYDEALLRPDAEDYAFERYFRWDYTKGTLEVNEQASPEDKRRAKIAVEFYRLNIRHPSLLRRELKRRAHLPSEPIDDFAYRDFIGSPPEVESADTH